MLLSFSLGTSGRCQITISSFSVNCGCRNRALSARIQEFLKSLMPWVPEALLTHFSFLSLHFSGSIPLLLDVSLCPGLIQIHLKVHAVCVLACLPIPLSLLPPSSFWYASPYLKMVSSFLHTFPTDQSLGFIFFHSQTSTFISYVHLIIFSNFPLSKPHAHLQSIGNYLASDSDIWARNILIAFYYLHKSSIKDKMGL